MGDDDVQTQIQEAMQTVNDILEEAVTTGWGSAGQFRERSGDNSRFWNTTTVTVTTTEDSPVEHIEPKVTVIRSGEKLSDTPKNKIPGRIGLLEL